MGDIRLKQYSDYLRGEAEKLRRGELSQEQIDILKQMVTDIETVAAGGTVWKTKSGNSTLIGLPRK